MKKIFLLLVAYLLVQFCQAQSAVELLSNAITNYNLKDFESTLDDCNDVIKLNDTLALAYYLRGIAKMELKDDSGSIKDFSTYLAMRPNSANVYYFRAYV